MRVLMVGAGSVGQVYGWHLQQGGVEVHVYVRPKYVEEARAGYLLYPPGSGLGEAPGSQGVRFHPDGIVTTAAEVAAQPWDQVWLCISSTGLRGGWLPEITAAMGNATLVSLLPGLRDRDLIAPLVPAERLVIGLIAFSAWHTPLRGVSHGASAGGSHGGTAAGAPAPGMAWWHPPFTPSQFEGTSAAVDPIVAALRKGGCPARKGDATATAARGSSFLLSMVAAMECAGWTFTGLRTEKWASLAAASAKEALTISTTHLGIAPGPLKTLASPTLVRLATRVVPLVAPMDFEAFLHAHFSKVGDQTLLAFDLWIAEGKARNLPTAALTDLAAELRRARGAQA